MSQLSKTAGKLWAIIACEVSENAIISEYAAFVSLILAQAGKDLVEKRRYPADTDNYSALQRDYDILRKSASDGRSVSLVRDMTISAINYSKNMTRILELFQTVTEIAVKWYYLDFEDATRFSSYRGGGVE